MYPWYVLDILRTRRGLGKDDTRHDADLQATPPMEALREVVAREFGRDDALSWIVERADACGLEIKEKA